ncbi:hypothetical protein ACUM9J_25570 [Klebsiella pneumoniae]
MALWQRLTGWLAFLSNGEAGQQDTQRVMEAILPVASLYGVDIGNVETRWFRHDKDILSDAGREKPTGTRCALCSKRLPEVAAWQEAPPQPRQF